MPPKKSPSASHEPPREKYASRPWDPGEEEAAIQKRAVALASGSPLVIDGAGGDQLEFLLLGTSIEPGGDIHLSIRINGTVHRGSTIATAKGQTVAVVVPAKTKEA